MRGFTMVVRYLVRGVWAACVMALAVPCAAQGVEVPTSPDGGDGRGTVNAPSAWVVLNTPVRKQVDLRLTGFYIGELETPVAQVDLPIRTSRFFTITPSYMYYTVRASGLNKLPRRPALFTDSYDEQQVRVDGTVAFAVRKFEISARNMYVRRFRPEPAADMNRYRGRMAVAHPLAIHGRISKPFASYEAYYEPKVGWNRHRIWSGLTVPVNKRVFVQPSYMWERSDGVRDVNYLLLGLIVNTR